MTQDKAPECDIYECANQLGGYYGPDTDEHLVAFLRRESDAAAALADEIVRLRAEVDQAYERGQVDGDKHLCGHSEVQTYTGAVTLIAPPHMTEAHPRGICVDVCLALEITKLWAEGITTTGCCCGHGSHPAYIGVIDCDIPRMKSLGYVVAPNPMRPGDEDSFVPRTRLGSAIRSLPIDGKDAT